MSARNSSELQINERDAVCSDVQKCGTTSMAGYLKAHPGISGLAGMPGSEIFSKESHFFGGMLGRGTTTNTLLYRSFFPTLLTR